MTKLQIQEEKDIFYKKIIEDYNTGLFKLKDLAKKYKIRYDTISLNLRKRGILTNPHGKIFLNSTIFNIIDTEEKAYWLGFLYADGCVHKNKKGYYRFELGLKESDKSHIEKFKNFLSSRHIIKHRLKTKSVRLTFGDPVFCKDLIRLGCIPNKSLILKFPTEEQVPKEYISHFIRGYVDGDGYISKKTKKRALTIDILGTHEFLNDLCKIINFDILKIIKKDKRHKNNTYSIVLCGNNAQLLGSFIYNNATVFLERKKENFNSHPKEFWHKPVLQYNLNGILIKEFYNGATCAKELGIHHTSISNACYSAKPLKNYIFKFKNNDN